MCSITIATACTVSTSQLQKVLRTCCALHIWTSKCDLHHTGVHFYISHLPRRLCTCHFSQPTFRPSGATNHWKTTAFRDFATFSRTYILCLLTLSLLWSSFFFPSLLWLFPPLLFHLPILSEVWLLNFLRYLRLYRYSLSGGKESEISQSRVPQILNFNYHGIGGCTRWGPLKFLALSQHSISGNFGFILSEPQ